jgi:ATP-dependent Clp protease ATP-binding subunit ClpA
VIGERLGVSRQAARQRYADRVERIREAAATGSVIHGRDLESSLSSALAAARADGLAEASTEHLLLGLLTDGVAAATLEQLGATRDKIREASHRLFEHATDRPGGGVPVFSAEAEAALAAAGQLATERTPDCAPIIVNTPQLLAVIATNPGSRARRVLNDLGVDVADIKRLLHCYINVPRTPFGRRSRRGRGGKKQHDRCSFCGHPRSEERRLVAGPDVWICAECVALCAEMLAQPADGGA